MASILIVSPLVPYPLAHGSSLRICHLYREVARRHDCHLAAFTDEGDPAGLRATGIFREILLLPPRPVPHDPRRHGRLSDSCYYRWGAPAAYRAAIARLREFAHDVRAGVTVGVTLSMAEFVAPLPTPHRVLDEIDCLTLAYVREEAARRRLDGPGTGAVAGSGPVGWLPRRLRRLRTARQEASLTSTFDLVTVVSPVDQEVLRRLNPRRPERVLVVPNGVDETLLSAPVAARAAERAVAFWGTFGFSVNGHAADFFLREIHQPFLGERGVRWHLIGSGLDGALSAAAAAAPGVVLPGHVPDLASYLAPIPIMVNPMISGGGIKNKVLEAFALGLTVVTTRMGIEALPAEDGVHCLVADTPADFTAAVLRLLDDAELRARLAANARRLVMESYRWETIGERWCRTLEGLLAQRTLR